MATQMELILRQDVPPLGKVGDVVKVSTGYARNYLLPRGLGAQVTADALQWIEREKARLRKEEADRIGVLKARAKKLEQVSATVSVKVGEEGQMYGSVGAAEIVKALAAEGVEVDPKQIVLNQPIKILGVADVSVRLHADVLAKIKVWVVEE